MSSKACNMAFMCERVLQADSQRMGWPLVVTWVAPWVDWVSVSAVSGQQSECQSSGGQSVSCQLSDVVSADCKLCRSQLADIAMILVPANVLTVNLTVIVVHVIVVVAGL